MKYYYVDDNNQSQGPIAPEDFGKHGITPQTNVWRDGMTAWTRAGELPELADVLKEAQDAERPSTMPPTPAASAAAAAETDYDDDVPAPECHLTRAIVGLILCSIPIPYVAIFGAAVFGILGITFNVVAYSAWRRGNYGLMERMERKSATFGSICLWIGVATWVFFIYLLCFAAGALTDIMTSL